MELHEQLADYSIALTTYEGVHRLPPSIFKQPDHLAIRTADIREFEHTVRSLNESAEKMVCVEDEGRFRVSAKMLGTLSLGLYGRVEWLEVLEDKQSGIDHTEFFYPDFSKLLESFHRGRVDYEVEAVNGHRSAEVSFQLHSKYFKFRVSDTPVAEIVAEEIDNGDAYILAA